ncbi:MAG: PAS domain S-box protein [Vulcanimicrobiaceae bacterium]
MPVSEPLDQYRRLIESLTDYAIFALSVDGRIASWNSGAKQTFGYDEHEVLGNNYSLIFTPEDIANGRPEAELLASLESGQSSIDGWHVRRDGSRERHGNGLHENRPRFNRTLHGVRILT